ncbi:hypothetical protein K503DRAFT_785767 [Rhizopogon vinicolor AM-OR11-026]|uniref:Uncharacterized protein n=1 Tax=Rhizopogon vinicolor AM-OR11-026 TaxID=1314800 RepID=A0A1B7MPA6_9AGAM|nr:hypothetical protein K503DRAFT_785767 [Rhizopogon vinicolor AM-OR11-026]
MTLDIKPTCGVKRKTQDKTMQINNEKKGEETRKDTYIRSYDQYAKTSVTVRRFSRLCEGSVTHELLVHQSFADEYLAPSLRRTTECAIEQVKAPAGTIQKDAGRSQMSARTPASPYGISGKPSFRGVEYRVHSYRGDQICGWQTVQLCFVNPWDANSCSVTLWVLLEVQHVKSTLVVKRMW